MYTNGEVTLDLNRRVQERIFNLNRDSFGIFGVFLWNFWSGMRCIWDNFAGGSNCLRLFGELCGDADLDVFFREKCLGNNFQL